jgi:hypothetical protein
MASASVLVAVRDNSRDLGWCFLGAISAGSSPSGFTKGFEGKAETKDAGSTISVGATESQPRSYLVISAVNILLRAGKGGHAHVNVMVSLDFPDHHEVRSQCI